MSQIKSGIPTVASPLQSAGLPGPGWPQLAMRRMKSAMPKLPDDELPPLDDELPPPPPVELVV